MKTRAEQIVSQIPEKSGDNKTYKWGSINQALMSAGVGTTTIVKVLRALKGQE